MYNKSMEVVILSGGLGTRISEETVNKPKPMVEIGGRPILWHIMKMYAHFGFNNFTVALGYKGEIIKDYFLHHHARLSDLRIFLKDGRVEYSNPTTEEWKVDLIDTGAKTMTGGRLLRLKPHLMSRGTFMLTYGDGLADINIEKLLDFHRSHGRIATVTAVHPLARFGNLEITHGQVMQFKEKPQSSEGWINGGFFVFESEIFDYLESDETVLEQSPLERLAQDEQFMAYEHSGYWQCMDTTRDRDALQALYDSGNPPWAYSQQEK